MAPPIHESDAQHASVLAPVIEFLRRYRPFSGMAATHLQFLAKRLRLFYYPQGTWVGGRKDDAAGIFHIVKQGRIVEASAATGRETDTRLLCAGDCFVTRIASSRKSPLTYRTVDDTFCLELEHEGTTKLMRTSRAFRDFCGRFCPDEAKSQPDDGGMEMDR